MSRTVEDLREDFELVLRLVRAEVAIRDRLCRSRPLERERWQRKRREAADAQAALFRLGEYIRESRPEERLPARPVQWRLYGEVDSSEDGCRAMRKR